MSKDLVPGAVLPDFKLPDHTGTMRRLSELQGDDPMILLLGRGEHCPRERQHQRELVKFHEWVRGRVHKGTRRLAGRPLKPKVRGHRLELRGRNYPGLRARRSWWWNEPVESPTALLDAEVGDHRRRSSTLAWPGRQPSGAAPKA
ncbi:MAG TPA: hypothetical protein VFC13_06135 [Actinomycetes bacterium]|jgi:hypothetical protein|nr:hypothetical protein [Actinomycetes bacterium]